jgi:glycosyltransferase involved in cell wall biosynthesis
MSRAEPRVTVLIPCFDDGATVAETVASARAQDEPVEIVIVDDGSTDAATLAVLDELERSGATVVHQPNGGTPVARTTGLGVTTTPLVLPLDADDVLTPGAVTYLADLLEARPDAAAAWGWYQRFGDETTLQPTAPTLDPWQITYMNELPATALYRRAAVEALYGWQPPNGYEDWGLWMGLAERGWTGIGTDRVIYHYRREGQRLAHQAGAQHSAKLAELRAAHPDLFAARRANWRRSTAPLALRLALPLLARMPGLSDHHKRLLGGVVSHLAHRRGVRLLARRVREQGRAAAGQ